MFGRLCKNVRFGDSLPQSFYNLSASSSCPFYHSVSLYTRCNNSASDRSLFVNFNRYSIDLSCRSLMLRSIQAEQYKIKKTYFIDELLTLDALVFPIMGAAILLLFSGFGTLLAVLNVFALSFSEKHLPYVACSVFVLYYIWSSYSYFTKTYHELALALFYYNKNSRQNQVNYVPHNSNQLQKLPSTADNDLENIMAIPKRLFDMACEELMPLREGVCKLILKIILIVSSVLIVFTLTILSTSETTPLMKTLLTFLTLSSPKIVAIYVDGGWQEKLRAMVVEEKVPKIVEKFLSETSETNREQRGRNVKTDEVILVNEDYIELARM